MKIKVSIILLVFAAVVSTRAQSVEPPTGASGDSVAYRTTFYFRHGVGDWIRESEYGKMWRLLKWAQVDTTTPIVIAGWADKSGTAEQNEKISLRRARTIRNYLVKQGIASERITFEGCGVDTQAATDEKARRADVRGVIRVVAETAIAPETPPIAVCEQKPQQPPIAICEQKQPEKERQQPTEPQVVAENTTVQPQQSFPTTSKAASSSGRYIGIKTNLAAWAGTIMNVAADVQVGKHVSVELPLLWCPWYVSDKHAVKTFTIQPEARYWLSRPGEGHFFGVHAHMGWYSVKWNRDRYQDTDRPLLGAGISYGYLLPFSEHWAGEFTLGAGYANMKYDTYYNIDNGARIDTRTKNYWGITRVGISVVYRFNLK